MGDSNSQIGHVGSWIPQVFYDLIGRIVPGAILLISGFLLVAGWKDSVEELTKLLGKEEIPYSLVLLTGVLFSYLTGILLGGFGYFAWDVANKCVRERYRGKLPVEAVKPPSKDKPGSNVSYIYDAIQHYEPAAGARLAKLRAEQNMCRVLAIGFAILAIIHLCVNWRKQYFFLSVGLIVLSVISTIMFNRHLSIRAHTLMLNYWDLLQNDNKIRVTEHKETVETRDVDQSTKESRHD